MQKILSLIFIGVLILACEQPGEKVRGIPSESYVEANAPDVKEEADELKKQGYQTFTYEEGDSTYLMQQYYLVLLKKGANRSQDSTEAAELQKQHLAHLSRMYKEGYSSLAGPMGDDGEIRGVVVYNTPTLQMADSLARLDPMVQVGRLEVEIHPWWAAKGGKLN